MSVLGSVTTGPLFDILSGNSVGVAVKTGRFFCINKAVNRLKPFLVNVLERRPPIAHCKCNPVASSSAVSGFCDLSGGKCDALMDKVPDASSIGFDSDQLLNDCHSEIECGKHFFCGLSSHF